jgi:predicted Zn-dependent peptidase
MYFHKFFTVDELIANIDAVDSAKVQVMAQRLFNPEHIAVTLLGRLNGIKLTHNEVVC